MKHVARLKSCFGKLWGGVIACVAHPLLGLRAFSLLPFFIRGFRISDNWIEVTPDCHEVRMAESNALYDYFLQNNTGPGIIKWRHYFEIYDRHFSKFRGSKVNLLEVGIYSGGSLPMWLSYFGQECHVWGVDIEEACKCYETDRVKVFIGDQQDRTFWAGVRDSAPMDQMNILIDDGGHTPEQQMVTLEETLPYMPAGSVYVCEDIHGDENQFSAFATALVHRLNRWELEGPKVVASNFQRAVHSIHFYPFLCVIEKHASPPQYLTAESNGTEWQPFPVGTR